MATHESWQFSFVREIGEGTKSVPNLGYRSPLKVEISGLTSGSAPNEDFPQIVTSSDHIRVSYSMPVDPQGYTLTGRVKILKKPKEFPRGYLDSLASVVVDEDYSNVLNTLDRDEYFIFIDEQVTSSRIIWYYTVFYEATDGNGATIWLFSPINSHDRGFALDSGLSAFGQQMFDYFPSGIRTKDKSEGEDTLYRLCQILGKPLDEIKERLDQFSDKRFKPNDVDAAFIPYIDNLLGWPTNFELREGRRRFETEDALNVWKVKGTNNAFELVLQRITGWNVELHEGYNHIVTTATPEDALDANTPPTGWVEATDGVWADQVNASPFNGTPDLSNPDHNYFPGSLNNPFRVIHDSSTWLNMFGVLVQLTSPLSEGSPLLRNLAQEKIDRLLDYLAIHYANFKVQVADIYNENLILNGLDSFSDENIRGVDESGELVITESISDETETGVLYTYPHADALESATNVTWSSSVVGNVGRIFHNALNQGI